MRGKRILRKIEQTPDQQRQLEEICERFQRERPGLEDLLAAGDATEVVLQGETEVGCAVTKNTVECNQSLIERR